MKRVLTVIASLSVLFLLGSQLIVHGQSPTGQLQRPHLLIFPGNPYGITIDDKNGAFTDAAAADFANVGVNVARIQLYWSDIQTQQSPPQYNWTPADTAIQNASKHSLLVDLAIQHAPTYDLPLINCKDQNGGQTSDNLPDAAAEGVFATDLVTRYNTVNGGGYQYGHIAFIEAGNEEWSFSKCKYDPIVYEPVLKAVHKAVKGVDSSVYVGMYGYTNYQSITQISNYFITLLTDVWWAMDYANFHFYHGDQPPDTAYTNKPAYKDVVNTIEAAAKAAGHASKPIWLTEAGYTINTNYGRTHPVTQQQQSDYEQTILDDSRNSTNVAKVLLYTMDDGCNGMSLTHEVYNPGPSITCKPPISYNIAYYNLQRYIKKYPIWH